jgi:hypothetical protein
MCSAGMSAFCQDDNISSICYSTGEFSLHVLKVILPVFAYS